MMVTMARSTAVVAVLGGYGRLGFALAEKMLRATDHRVRLIGRDAVHLGAAAEELSSSCARDRVDACVADAADVKSMCAALQGVDLLVVCIAGSNHTGTVERALIAAGADCVDLRYPRGVQEAWRARDGDLRSAGRRVFIHAGHLPGLPGLLVRRALTQSPSLHRLVLATAMSPQPPLSVGAAAELLDELRNSEPARFEDGRWRPCHMWDARRVDFAGAFGRRVCLPLMCDELRTMPPGVEHMQLLVAGFGGFVNGVVVPLALMCGQRRDGWLGQRIVRLMQWGVNRLSGRPAGAVLHLAAADSDGRVSFRIAVQHEDSYALAAAAVVACLRQRDDGLWMQAGVHSVSATVDVGRALDTMRALGVTIDEQVLSV